MKDRNLDSPEHFYESRWWMDRSYLDHFRLTEKEMDGLIGNLKGIFNKNWIMRQNETRIHERHPISRYYLYGKGTFYLEPLLVLSRIIQIARKMENTEEIISRLNTKPLKYYGAETELQLIYLADKYETKVRVIPNDKEKRTPDIYISEHGEGCYVEVKSEEEPSIFNDYRPPYVRNVNKIVDDIFRYIDKRKGYNSIEIILEHDMSQILLNNHKHEVSLVTLICNKIMNTLSDNSTFDKYPVEVDIPYIGVIKINKTNKNETSIKYSISIPDVSRRITKFINVLDECMKQLGRNKPGIILIKPYYTIQTKLLSTILDSIFENERDRFTNLCGLILFTPYITWDECTAGLKVFRNSYAAIDLEKTSLWSIFNKFPKPDPYLEQIDEFGEI